MQTQLAALAQTSVLQLRDALRRVTAAHAAAALDERDDPALPADAGRGEPFRAEWQETVIDVRQIRA